MTRTPVEEMTATERAEAVHFMFWSGLDYDRSYDSPIVPADSRGYWPYTTEKHDGMYLLRYDALEPLLHATGAEIVTCALEWANSVRPLEGGQVDFYYQHGDDVPLVRFWFEPATGHDLL